MTYSGRRIRFRGYLPHQERDGATYFVTSRLADSLPQCVLIELRERKNRIARATAAGRDLLDSESISIKRIEKILDESSGDAFLRNPAAAAIVDNVLRSATDRDTHCMPHV